MTHVLDGGINPNHPCAGKNCNECETCIFDQSLFLDKDTKNMNDNTYEESCHRCSDLIKNYYGDGLRFNACCGRCKIQSNSYMTPRVIKSSIGPMIPLPIPDWCPKKRGVTIEVLTPSDLIARGQTLALPSKPSLPISNESTNKPMTYYEKKEKLMSFPSHIEWDDIEEGGVYVVPKILSQNRKVVRVVIKSETLLRCSEINEYGEESKSLISIYPKDIDAVFITKVLKY